MQNKLTDIHSISAIQQNLSYNLYSLKLVNFEDLQIGAGAVGSVFKVTTIDGIAQDGLLLKIVSEEDFRNKSYETIFHLHEKINERQLISKIPVFDEVPELNGLPFLAFKGKLNSTDKEVTGFVMKDLGYFGFSDMGSENWDRNKYIQGVGFEEKLYLCYQFSRGVNFLHELKFIHADLKDVSIFVNPEKPQLSIIDYDGGYNYDKQGFALTLGAINSWASKYWRKLMGQGTSSKDISLIERLDEENWVLANGLFEVLFGIPPFHFIKNLEDDSLENYLKENQWPYFSDKSEYVNKESVHNHKVIIELMEALSKEGLKPIIDKFKTVFNEGFFRTNKRLTPKQWKDLIFEISKELVGAPRLEAFQSNKTEIKKKDEKVNFQWKGSFFRAVYLNDSLVDSFKNESEISLEDELIVTIKLVNDFGVNEAKLQIHAVKTDPIILKFESNIYLRTDLSPVILKWETSNCKEVHIANEVLSPTGTFEINPIERSVCKLVAKGFFNQEVFSEIIIDVEQVKINLFKYEINIEKGIDNIDLFWETEHATDVEITPNLGKVELNGSTSIGIIDKTEFTIKVKGFFNSVNKTIEAQPFPIPIIKGLFIPTPILKLETAIPTNLLEIPIALTDSLKVNVNNNILYNSPEPSFINFNESQIVKNTAELSDKNINNLSELFNNLFDRINKK